VNETQQINIVLNWTEELQAKVPTGHQERLSQRCST
jgi:hypothetical protein